MTPNPKLQGDFNVQYSCLSLLTSTWP